MFHVKKKYRDYLLASHPIQQAPKRVSLELKSNNTK